MAKATRLPSCICIGNEVFISARMVGTRKHFKRQARTTQTHLKSWDHVGFRRWWREVETFARADLRRLPNSGKPANVVLWAKMPFDWMDESLVSAATVPSETPWSVRLRAGPVASDGVNYKTTR